MLKRLMRLLASVLDPRPWVHVFRLVHFYNYSYVVPVRAAKVGRQVAMAPNVSLRNGDRITIGDRSHIGARCSLWAGEDSGRITIGEDALFGPEVYVTASNYEVKVGEVVYRQPRIERDVHIGAGVWLGARVIVLPGVTIGDGCVVGAGSVVSKSLPRGAIAAGAPARVIAERT